MSYLLVSGGKAAVIDPRRDVDVYLTLAAERGARITHVFETHRNEDLISGAPILAARTGAKVLHGPNPAAPIRYAETTREGELHRVGEVVIRVLETPGHTEDSVSYVVIDEATGDGPIGVFTGDALFVGDVGRTDFYPDKPREMAGALYDSLQKLLALGDQAVVWPAHGAGSVCGAGMADRLFSTIGYERRFNPRLSLSREAFIEAKVKERHVYPPYFRRMERLNVEGAPPMLAPLVPEALDVETFEARAPYATVLDVRETAAFLRTHRRGSLGLSAGLVSAFAGFLLDADEDVVLVAETAEEARAVSEELGRMGFDRVIGFLARPWTAWTATGRPFESIEAIGAKELDRRLASPPASWQMLDVRSEEEVRSGMLAGAKHIYVGELPQRLRELDATRAYTVVCGSGVRATLAASILRRGGVREVDVFLGSLGASYASSKPPRTRPVSTSAPPE